MTTRSAPHPIPYQGSKRNLTVHILRYFPREVATLYEPFAGSAAVTIAAAANGLARKYHANDLNVPLMELWRQIIYQPEELCTAYRRLWTEQLDDPKSFYFKVREEFNRSGSPELLLYLLARCVKGSVRYNSRGEFNQSPDNRRRGMRPSTMRSQVVAVCHLLKGKITITAKDFREVLDLATPHDLIYMDPPYQGVCRNRDARYLRSVPFPDFVKALCSINARHLRFLVSYDGRTGSKTYGPALPDHLGLRHIELQAGRSTQATLLGRDHMTIESLYLSPALADEIGDAHALAARARSHQRSLFWSTG